MREDTSSIGSPEVHVPESDRGPAEACVERLARIGFAAEARLEVEVLPHRVDGGPERGRRELDDRVPNGVLDFSVLDEVRLAARILRVVALVVDVPLQDRKSTRLNSSHSQISYAVFCLKKKKDNSQQNPFAIPVARLYMGAALYLTNYHVPHVSYPYMSSFDTERASPFTPSLGSPRCH